MSPKQAAIRRLLDAITAAFGPSAFPLDGQQPDSPGHVILASARDRRFSASIIALPGRQNRFSVMVELYDPPNPRLVPFEVAADGEFSSAEVLELLERYRDWHRAEPGAAPDPALKAGPGR